MTSEAPNQLSIGRTWQLWANRSKGAFWHIGARKWVELHQLGNPVAVLVEEILDDLFTAEVTHYGWQDAKPSPSRKSDAPTMIQIRTGSDPTNPKRALMFLNMCFPYGLDAAIARGDGSIVALRITERPDAG